MDKQILFDNIGRIQTTDMGVDRIKKNLSLGEVDVVEWCKSKIMSEKAEISKQGKEIRRGPYMILDMMQVSSECRGQGIGRKLFEAGKDEARKAGAEALYISACSSEETIAFYRAMGSELASNPIKEIAEEEPFDLQMICPVKD